MMNYHGYAHDPSEGHSQQPDPAVPRPSFEPAAYAGYQAQTSASPYGYQHAAIPGLGMGLPSGGHMDAELSYAAGPANAQQQRSTKASIDMDSTRRVIGMEDAEDDDMDEGEIDEGEVDDAYEPSLPQGPPTSGLVGPYAVARPQTDMTLPDQQERGSYSPFLSPQEVTMEQGGLIGNSQDSLGSTKSSAPRSPPQTSLEQHPPAKHLAEARKQAQDAILRLWPLNVRFQDYIDAGIDENILQELFLGLGFDLESSSAAVPLTAPPAPKAPAKTASLSVPSAPPAVESQKDASETRKDRIARRLAAKGTDQPVLSPELPKATPAPKSQAPTPGKINLDKSKLLQQKMEALKKAREGKQATSEPSDAGITTPQLVPQPSQVVKTNDKPLAEPEDTSTESTAAIPGISVSSTPRPTSTNSFKRPVASDLNDLSNAPFKRPFGHSREPQKFLIDVSDDEDDAAMDLDSPELRPASVNKTNSPFKIPSFADIQSGFMGRQMSSPMATPPILTSGEEDYETKMKDIAELKRKIAQREAESSRIRASRPASPAVGASAPPVRAVSVTSGSAVQTPNVSASSLPGRPLQAMPSTSFAGESQKLPKPSELRQSEQPRSGRSRSRAASERLITEAQAKRREKELKLQLMQSQIRRMEKEIQDSVDAEERMRAEAEEESDAASEDDPLNRTATPSIPNPEVLQEAGPPPTSAPIPSAEDPVSAQVDEPVVAGLVQEEDLESDAAAAMSSAEGAADATNESAEQSEILQQEEQPEDDLQMQDEQMNNDESNPSSSGTSDHQVDEVMADHEVPQEAMAEEVSSSPVDTPEFEEPQEVAAAVEEASSAVDTSEDEDEEGEEEEAEKEEEEAEQSSAPASLDVTRAPEPEAQVESSDSEMPDASATSPVAQPISTGQAESRLASPREQQQVFSPPTGETSTGTSFLPYESTLKQFRAYRFHPDFANSVSGGLRSLTYSNEIDPKLPICPDDLAGVQCPRGADCIYQHFETMRAPDDQILMQLGGYGNFEGEQKQEFNNGLRKILADARANKIRDFDTLAKSIIDYRASFRKDPYKVLPLGDVKL